MSTPKIPDMAGKWVIAHTQLECTVTACSNNRKINAGDVCMLHQGGGTYACRECAAEFWHDDTLIDKELFAGGFIKFESGSGPIKILSFGYKFGIPADFKVFDIRKTIRNPWQDKELRKLNGLDARIQQFVWRCPRTAVIVKQIEVHVQYGLSVAIGCQGGKHRSVAVAEMVAALAREAGMDVIVEHRDLKLTKPRKAKKAVIVPPTEAEVKSYGTA